MNKTDILIVENDPKEQRRLVNFFKGKNLTYRTAEKGKDALRMIDKEKFRLVVLDIDLDDEITGIDVAVKLMKQGGSFIFNTQFPESFNNALKLKPVSFIDKKDPDSIFRHIELFLFKNGEEQYPAPKESDEIPVKLFTGDTMINRKNIILAESIGKEHIKVYLKGINGRPNHTKQMPYTLKEFVELIGLRTFMKIKDKYAVNFTSEYVHSFNGTSPAYVRLNENTFRENGTDVVFDERQLMVTKHYAGNVRKMFKTTPL